MLDRKRGRFATSAWRKTCAAGMNFRMGGNARAVRWAWLPITVRSCAVNPESHPRAGLHRLTRTQRPPNRAQTPASRYASPSWHLHGDGRSRTSRRLDGKQAAVTVNAASTIPPSLFLGATCHFTTSLGTRRPRTGLGYVVCLDASEERFWPLLATAIPEPLGSSRITRHGCIVECSHDRLALGDTVRSSGSPSISGTRPST